MIRLWASRAALLAACIVGILLLLCFGAWLLIFAGAVYVTLGLFGLAVWIGGAIADAWP